MAQGKHEEYHANSRWNIGSDVDDVGGVRHVRHVHGGRALRHGRGRRRARIAAQTSPSQRCRGGLAAAPKSSPEAVVQCILDDSGASDAVRVGWVVR